MTYTENHYGDYRRTEQANSLRASGATCGGAARYCSFMKEPIVIIREKET